jgi:hypothetical protein
MIVPLDSEKGVFTSRIHLLDELSIQALSQEHLKSTKSSVSPGLSSTPRRRWTWWKDALVLMNAPSGVAGIRDLTAQLTGISTALGRDVQVLASSAERAISLARTDDLRERIISRQHVLSGDFHLKPQSTLIIEGAERLGLKETLVLLGEARAQDAQLVFLSTARDVRRTATPCRCWSPPGYPVPAARSLRQGWRRRLSASRSNAIATRRWPAALQS